MLCDSLDFLLFFIFDTQEDSYRFFWLFLLLVYRFCWFSLKASHICLFSTWFSEPSWLPMLFCDEWVIYHVEIHNIIICSSASRVHRVSWAVSLYVGITLVDCYKSSRCFGYHFGKRLVVTPSRSEKYFGCVEVICAKKESYHIDIISPSFFSP